jgi:hypothetical protein
MGDERLTFEEVEREHLDEVNVDAHWAYLLGVLALGGALMLVLISLLGSGQG